MTVQNSTVDTVGAPIAPTVVAASATTVGREHTTPSRSGRWVAITATTVVAGVAAVVSYDHMRTLAERAGETWKSDLIPLAIDGMVIDASTVLLARRRAGRPGGVLAWLALLGGVLVSLAANAAAAQPTLVGRAIALVPRLALAVSFELVRSLGSTHHSPAGRQQAGEGDHAPPATLQDRAAELVANAGRNGSTLGRGRLARELDITEHQARQLLDRLAETAPTAPVQQREARASIM